MIKMHTLLFSGGNQMSKKLIAVRSIIFLLILAFILKTLPVGWISTGNEENKK